MSARKFCACGWAVFGTTMCRLGKYEFCAFFWSYFLCRTFLQNGFKMFKKDE
jgi:hypothetical protein